MNIDDLTIGQVKGLVEMFPSTKSNSQSAFQIGKIYFIRTVTMIDTGRVVEVNDNEIVLEDAAWIADVLISLEFSEVEPFPNGKVIIGRGAIVDAVQIKKAPRVQK